MQTVARLKVPGEAQVTISVTTTLENWEKIAETIGVAKDGRWHPAAELRREIRDVVEKVTQEFREYGPDAEREEG